MKNCYASIIDDLIYMYIDVCRVWGVCWGGGMCVWRGVVSRGGAGGGGQGRSPPKGFKKGNIIKYGVFS